MCTKLHSPKNTPFSQPLGKYFNLSELVASDTAKRNKIDNTPTKQVIENLTYLVKNILDPARQELGEPITITSGFRCRKLNTLVGGALYSKHIQGKAADIRIKSKEYGQRLFDILSKNKKVDTLLYEHNKLGTTWLHVSWNENPRNLCIRDYRV